MTKFSDEKIKVIKNLEKRLNSYIEKLETEINGDKNKKKINRFNRIIDEIKQELNDFIRYA